jgi:hypothetical protein
VTPGNVAALTSTGLPMKGAPAPAGPLGAPQNLRASAGDMPGEVDLMWDPLKGSSMNVVQHRVQGTAADVQDVILAGAQDGRLMALSAEGKLLKMYTGNEWTPDQLLADLKPVARAD